MLSFRQSTRLEVAYLDILEWGTSWCDGFWVAENFQGQFAILKLWLCTPVCVTCVMSVVHTALLRFGHRITRVYVMLLMWNTFKTCIMLLNFGWTTVNIMAFVQFYTEHKLVPLASQVNPFNLCQRLFYTIYNLKKKKISNLTCT